MVLLGSKIIRRYSRFRTKKELKFLGCDDRIEKADPTEEKWCYTNGPCPQNSDPMSDSYQPFQSGGSGTVRVDNDTNDQVVTWRRCSKTKFQDEPEVKAAKAAKAATMKKMIDAKFNEFSQVIGAQQCKGKEKETCLDNNFNTCVPKCFKKNTMDRAALLTELKPYMECGKGLQMGDSDLITKNCGIKVRDENNKETDVKTIIMTGKLNNQIKQIVKNEKYRDIQSTECLGGKVTYVSKNNDSCCKKEDSCPRFLENELGLIPSAEPAGKIDSSCIRDDGNYNVLPNCSEKDDFQKCIDEIKEMIPNMNCNDYNDYVYNVGPIKYCKDKGIEMVKEEYPSEFIELGKVVLAKGEDVLKKDLT